MNKLNYSVLLVILIMITGCTAKISENQTTYTNKDSAVKTPALHLNVSYSEYVPKSENLRNSITELKKLIAQNYRGEVFSLDEKSTNGLDINISVERFRYVSGFGRFMAGVMVGKAELKLLVKVVDRSNNQLLVESSLDTSSKFIEGIFGATTSRQIEAMSKKIIELVSFNDKKEYKIN